MELSGWEPAGEPWVPGNGSVGRLPRETGVGRVARSRRRVQSSLGQGPGRLFCFLSSSLWLTLLLLLSAPPGAVSCGVVLAVGRSRSLRRCALPALGKGRLMERRGFRGRDGLIVTNPAPLNMNVARLSLHPQRSWRGSFPFLPPLFPPRS